MTPRSSLGAFALAALVLAPAGCGNNDGVGEDAEPRGRASAMRAAGASGDGESDSERTSRVGSARELLGGFLADYWEHLPLEPMGPAPADFNAVDRSLDPESCAACHPEQHAQWSTSLHAGAFSPGFAGQLIEGSLAAPHEVRNCQSCHNPLGEQQPWNAAGLPERVYDPELRAQGLVCAGCHVRVHRRYGPPRRSGLPVPTGAAPHGGFEARPEFEDSRFCARCHQFFDDAGVNGKPVENTYVEWQASPQAAEGRSCQSCHMPDRAHVWRGIHDAETVRAAVDVEFVQAKAPGGTLRGSLVLTNRDVGHAFPTYVTPRVYLSVFQADAEGAELDGTRSEATIGREIDFGANREVIDTRVLPGRTAILDYAAPRHPDATAIVARAEVDPDFHYRGVFASLLASLEDPEALSLLREAQRRATESAFVLWEATRPL